MYWSKIGRKKRNMRGQTNAYVSSANLNRSLSNQKINYKTNLSSGARFTLVWGTIPKYLLQSQGLHSRPKLQLFPWDLLKSQILSLSQDARFRANNLIWSWFSSRPRCLLQGSWLDSKPGFMARAKNECYKKIVKNFSLLPLTTQYLERGAKNFKKSLKYWQKKWIQTFETIN